MKILQTRKRLLVFYMPAFLAGILYVNLTVGRMSADAGIFSSYFLEQYQATEIVTGEYLLYLLPVRILPFLVLLGLAFTKMRKAAAVLFLVWTGFSSGFLLSMAVLSLGIKGIILCLAGVFPQFLFYVPAYLLVLWYSYSYPRGEWNLQKSIGSGVMILMGLIMELYVSPSLIRVFLRTL